MNTGHTTCYTIILNQIIRTFVWVIFRRYINNILKWINESKKAKEIRIHTLHFWRCTFEFNIHIDASIHVSIFHFGERSNHTRKYFHFLSSDSLMNIKFFIKSFFFLISHFNFHVFSFLFPQPNERVTIFYNSVSKNVSHEIHFLVENWLISRF